MKRRNWLIALVGMGISVVLLLVAFRNLQPEQVWQSIQQANGTLLLIAAGWYFAAVTVITLRWQFLLRGIQLIPLQRLLPLVCIGYAGNNIYPFRSGEVLRILLLQRQFGVALARGTTTVVVERIFDGLVMLSFILLPLALLDISSPEAQTVVALATPLFLVALLIFFVLAARPNLLRRFYSGPLRFVLPVKLYEPLGGLVEDVITGLNGLRTPLDLMGTILCSYLTWALEASVYWIVAQAFGLEVGYLTMLLVVGVVNLAGLIPASPGQFGVFEAFASLVLVASGVPEALALAFALTVHMVIWLPVTLVGLFFLLQQGLNLSSITRSQQLKNKAVG